MTAPALELRALQQHFGATRVLQGIDLAVPAGERLAIIGPNGAGKSSLFDAISGRSRPSGGAVLLHGRPITGLAPQRIRRRGLSRSFQVSRLFATLDARDHLHCALAGAQGGVLRLLRGFDRAPRQEAEVETLLKALELGDRAGLPAASLSYAEQRLLELALAFCGDPSVVLLDEPTAGMSQDETRRCTALIRRWSAGRTVLVVEHDMEVVFGLADRIAVLSQGRLLALGTPGAVRADPAVRAVYTGT